MKYIIGLIFLITLSTVSFAQTITVKNSGGVESVNKPLVVIDGKVMPRLVKSKTDSTRMVSPTENLESSQIQFMEIIKGPEAKAAYGDDGKYGVVKITMKK